MPIVTLQLNSTTALPVNNRRKQELLRLVVNHCMKALAGTGRIDSWRVESISTLTTFPSSSVATFLGSSLSGAVGAVINGTTITATAAGGDTASTTLVVAAINANATMQGLGISATQRVATMTCASVVAGNEIDVLGEKFLAVAAATTNQNQFFIGASDDACAVNLAAAINRNPVLQAKCIASPHSSSGVCYLGIKENRAPRSDEVILQTSGATITVVQFAVGAIAMVFTAAMSALGNCCTFVASGSGASVQSNVSGKLGMGIGGAPIGVVSGASVSVSSDTRS